MAQSFQTPQCRCLQERWCGNRSWHYQLQVRFIPNVCYWLSGCQRHRTWSTRNLLVHSSHQGKQYVMRLLQCCLLLYQSIAGLWMKEGCSLWLGSSTNCTKTTNCRLASASCSSGCGMYGIIAFNGIFCWWIVSDAEWLNLSVVNSNIGMIGENVWALGDGYWSLSETVEIGEGKLLDSPEVEASVAEVTPWKECRQSWSGHLSGR